MKRLLLALVVMVLAAPPATPTPLVAVCCGDGDCQVEDCRMECGTTSEVPPITRSVSTAPATAPFAKALQAPTPAGLTALVLAVAQPIDLPNLSAGLRPPLRN